MPPLQLRDRSRRAPFARTAAGRTGLAVLLVLGVIAVAAPHLAPHDPFASVAAPLRPPSGANLMGSDDLGRDILSGVLHGVRTSMLVALGVTAVSSVIGICIGSVAGYAGRVVDDVLMRLTELVQVLPRFFLAVVVIAFFGSGYDRLILLLGLTSWPSLARVARAEVLSLRERAFVEAARAVGGSTAHILFRHTLPNITVPLAVVAGATASAALLTEAGLAFLGLGDPEVVSLGALANNGQRFLRVAWWMALFPGAALASAALAINLLIDGVTDAIQRRTQG